MANITYYHIVQELDQGIASSYNNSGTHKSPQLPYNTYQDDIMFIIREDTLGIDPMAPCLCNRLIICLSTEPVFNNNC